MTDVLLISAHPDDVELSCAGTVKKLTNEGRRVVFVECTRGELGSRGTAELRAEEARNAAAILGVTERENLGMPDGGIMHTNENIMRVVEAIRAYKPTIMLIPPPFERHPDHEAVHRLARAAAFLSGLTKVRTTRNGVDQEPHQPSRMFCFEQQYELQTKPDLYVDVTDTHEARMESIYAYTSQFHLPHLYTSDEPTTYISRPEFLEELVMRSRHYGRLIGVQHAEAFMSIEPIGVDSLSVFL